MQEPTTQDLLQFFKVYTDEIDKCKKAECYWSMLCMVLTLPDVCNTLEQEGDDKDSKIGRRYKAWCKTTGLNLCRIGLTEEELYTLRCKVLHQGETQIGDKLYGEIYPPGSPGHSTVQLGRLRVDLGILTDELVLAISKWCNAVIADVARFDKVKKSLPGIVWESKATPGAYRSDVGSSVSAMASRPQINWGG